MQRKSHDLQMPVGNHKLVHSYLGSRFVVYSIQKHTILKRQRRERERERERERVGNRETEKERKRLAIVQV